MKLDSTRRLVFAFCRRPFGFLRTINENSEITLFELKTSMVFLARAF